MWKNFIHKYACYSTVSSYEARLNCTTGRIVLLVLLLFVNMWVSKIVSSSFVSLMIVIVIYNCYVLYRCTFSGIGERCVYDQNFFFLLFYTINLLLFSSGCYILNGLKCHSPSGAAGGRRVPEAGGSVQGAAQGNRRDTIASEQLVRLTFVFFLPPLFCTKGPHWM